MFKYSHRKILQTCEWGPREDSPICYLDALKTTGDDFFRQRQLSDGDIQEWIALRGQWCLPPRLTEKGRDQIVGGIRLLLCERTSTGNLRVAISRASFELVENEFSLHTSTLNAFSNYAGVCALFSHPSTRDDPHKLQSIDLVVKANQNNEVANYGISLNHNFKTSISSGLLCGKYLIKEAPTLLRFLEGQMSHMQTMLEDSSEFWIQPSLLPCILLRDYAMRLQRRAASNHTYLTTAEALLGVSKAGTLAGWELPSSLAKVEWDTDRTRKTIRQLTEDLATRKTEIVYLKRSYEWAIHCASFLEKATTRCRENSPLEGHRRTEILSQNIEFQNSELENGIKFVGKLQERVELQLDVLYSFIAQNDNKLNARAAAALSRDSMAMKVLALITSLFLPGSFVAALFSMDMFNWHVTGKDEADTVPSQFWIFWVITVPLTLMVMLIWRVWWRWENARFKQEVGIALEQVNNAPSRPGKPLETVRSTRNKQKTKSRKRLKADEREEQEFPSKNADTEVQSTAPVRLDDLQWKKVDIPENMDDYEGLYGLEEIDGVEVVKNESGTYLSFRLPNRNKRRPNMSEDSSAVKSVQSARKASVKNTSSAQYEEEWSGFDDDSDGSEVRPTPSAAPKKQGSRASTKSSEGTVSKPNGTKPHSGTKDEDILQTTRFALLEDHDEETDTDISAWRFLDLSSEVLSSLSQMGFSQPTEIQASAIPCIREGNDLIGKAPTGSGKTLAFGIPIIEDILLTGAEDFKRQNKSAQKRPSALILLPTRELAHQIGNHIQALINGTTLDSIKVATITGGLSILKQKRILTYADIIVGTPGRLWEVISEGHGVLESIKGIRFLVVDEADRLLSEGNYKELEEIIAALDKEVTHEKPSHPSQVQSTGAGLAQHNRQTLVFSATFSKSLHQKLSGRSGFRKSQLIHNKADTMEYLLHKLNFRSVQPAFIDVNPVQQMAANLREGIVECTSGTEKDLYLYTLLLYHHPGARALVFVNSISAVKRLVPLLTNLGLVTFPLHSHMPQKARLRSVERFSELTSASNASNSGAERKPKSAPGSLPQMQGSKVLVATDVAARGLDIPNITLVIHYHLPRAADAYVHRSGRTARASNSGSSILLCAPEEVAGVRKLVAQVHADATSSPGQDKDYTSGEANQKTNKHKSGKFFMQTLYPDSKLVSALRPRVNLAKKMADSVIVKDKKRKEDDFFRAAAEELGVSSASDDSSDGDQSRKHGRKKQVVKISQDEQKGKGAKRRMEGLSVTPDQMRSMRAELRALLDKKINVGISEKYLVSKGGEEVAKLLREREKGSAEGSDKTGGGPRFSMSGILGNVAPLGWDI